MNVSKRLLPAVLMMLIGVFALQAQRPVDRSMDPEKMAEKQTINMVEKLSLDEKQAEKVKTINLKYAKHLNLKREQIKAEKVSREADRQKMQEARKAELKKVLTPEQFNKLEEAQAAYGDRKELRKRGSRNRRAGAAQGQNKNLSSAERSDMQTNKMVERLGLNEKQAGELRQVNLDFAKKRESFRAAGQKERETNREKMQQLHGDQKAAIAKILTPEQMKQWEEEMQSQRGSRRPQGKQRLNDGRM